MHVAGVGSTEVARRPGRTVDALRAAERHGELHRVGGSVVIVFPAEEAPRVRCNCGRSRNSPELSSSNPPVPGFGAGVQTSETEPGVTGYCANPSKKGCWSVEPSPHVEVVGESTAADESVTDLQTGQVRILADRCKTCILNPAERRLPIPSTRLRAFLAEAREADGHVVCHRTLPDGAPLGVQPAMCRGYTDTYGLPPAAHEALGLGQLVEQDDFP